MNTIAKRIATPVLATVLLIGLAACEGNKYGQKQTGGAVLGGVVGGLLGSQVGGGKGKLAATAAGTVLGIFLGSEVGKSLDKADRLHAQRTANQAFERNPVGQTSTWSNPDTGHSGSVTPTRTVYLAPDQPCRDYETTVTIDGRTETATGRACRQADGTWKIVN
jgi:surface antigen